MRTKYYLSIIFIILTSLITTNIFANEDNIKQVFSYIKTKEWDLAMKYANMANDPVLKKIVLGQQLLDSRYSANNFEKAVKFLRDNPHWPEAEKIKKRAEDYLNNHTNQQLILNWFNHNKPKTSNGYRYYALAAANSSLNNNLDIIKDALIHDSFSLIEEKKYFAKFQKFISSDDYLKRLNEYMWQQKLADAKQLLPLVDNKYIPTFNAYYALTQKGHDKDKLFAKVNSKYYLESLVFHYLKSKKTEKPNANSIRLFNMIKPSPEHADEWAGLRLYYAREFIDYKDFASSYKIISQHEAINTDNAREAEWLAGWLALRHLNKPKLALEHFKSFFAHSKRPISVAKAEYWLARTYAVLKENALSKEHYQRSANYPYTFYGQLSLIELGKKELILPTTTKIDSAHKERFESDEGIKTARLWGKYGSFEMAHLYAKSAMDKAHSPGDAAMIANYVVKNYNEPYYKVMLGKEASYHGAFIKEYAYPTPYNLQHSPIDPAFAYAIMRQESLFHPSLTSSAGAMGVMQLMKATACAQAKSMGMKCNVKKLLTDPAYNILLGTHHLKHLLQYRKGSYVLAIASYNANPKKVDRWIDLFGDPRKMSKLHNVVDWIEMIPFSETRNYVQRVIETIPVYHTILNRNNKLTIIDYLM